jgi:DNA-nicking Smr family endonuclease
VSSKQRDLRPEERDLWRRVTKTIAPRRLIIDDDEPPSTASFQPADFPPSQTAPAKRLASAHSAPAQKPTPVADRGGEKRVRRGKLEIGGSLDLHGHTLVSGRDAVIGFLHAAQRRGDGVVIIVTGKGRVGEGVLKRSLPGWLGAHEVRPLISGFAQAHRDHGGAGAFYVFLKRG